MLRVSVPCALIRPTTSSRYLTLAKPTTCACCTLRSWDLNTSQAFQLSPQNTGLPRHTHSPWWVQQSSLRRNSPASIFQSPGVSRMTSQNTSKDRHTSKKPPYQSIKGTTSISQRRSTSQSNSSTLQKEKIIGQLSIGVAQVITGTQPQKLFSKEIAPLPVGGESRIPNTCNTLPQQIPQ